MTANQRRPGFRLPWSSEMDEQGGDAAPGTEAPAVEGAPSDPDAAAAPPQPEAAGTSPDPAGATSEAEAAPVAAAAEGAPDDAARADADAPAEPTGDGQADASTTESPAAQQPAAAGAQPDDFLRDLVAAMRGVADEARQTGVAELKAKADEQVRRLEADAERRREELRVRAEKDVAEVGEWAKAEAERISREAEQRVAARRTQLEQQLASDTDRTEGETTAVRERVAEYERELDAYHAQLLQINDPAAFAAAAKRMPPPPPLTPTADPPKPASVTSVAAAAPAPDSITPTASGSPDAAAPVEPVQPDSNGVPASAGEVHSAEEVHPAEEEVLAVRLAQLDATLPAAGAGDEAPAAVSAEPTTTEVVVKGLGSFGAITGFRQALSGVPGIDGVALSLGQTGEFVFRATHATGFDVRSAIAQLEGDGAKVEDRPEGGLRVTLERAR